MIARIKSAASSFWRKHIADEGYETDEAFCHGIDPREAEAVAFWEAASKFPSPPERDERGRFVDRGAYRLAELRKGTGA